MGTSDVVKCAEFGAEGAGLDFIDGAVDGVGVEVSFDGQGEG